MLGNFRFDDMVEKMSRRTLKAKSDDSGCAICHL